MGNASHIKYFAAAEKETQNRDGWNKNENVKREREVPEIMLRK